MCKGTDGIAKKYENRTNVRSVLAIMETLGLNENQAMDALKIPAEDRDTVLSMMNASN